MSKIVIGESLKINFKKHLHNIINIIDFEKNDISQISVLNGVISKCIFLCNIRNSKKVNCGNVNKKNGQIINSVINYIENNTVNYNYIDGICGFGWGVSYLINNKALNAEDTFSFVELDALLYEIAIQDLKNSNYDFFYGGVGYGNYFLQRLKTESIISKFLEEFVIELDRNKRTTKGLVFWQDKQDQINDIVDFSFSHGQASILVFLAKLYVENINKKLCYSLLEKGCMYAIESSVYKSGGLCFPDNISKGEPEFSPIRWCHGQLGIVFSLAFSGKVLNNEFITKKAIEGAISISKLKINDQELTSPMVCHGTLGVAHLFSKIYNILDDDQIKKAAIYWYNQSDVLIESNGYEVYEQGKNSLIETGVLSGIEGIGLSILSALDTEMSDWDSCILLS